MRPAVAVGGFILVVGLIAVAAHFLERHAPTHRPKSPLKVADGLAEHQPNANSVDHAAIFALTFNDQHGKRVPMGTFSGKTLVLNFWATWCAPCREEIPEFVRLQQTWRDKGVQFVGISVDQPQKVQEFAEALQINYPLLMALDTGLDLSKSLGNRLGVLPHTLVLSPSGDVLLNRVGPVNEALMRAVIGEKIAEKATTTSKIQQ
jgi:thiol-disulfide isomerase/thioredoxin